MKWLLIAKLSATGSGEIRCRLLGGEAQFLGHWLSKRVTDTYRPSFVISKSGPSLNSTKIVISEEVLEKLTKKGLFSVPFELNSEEEAEIVIRLCLSEELQDWFMISGMPKRLTKSVLSGMSFIPRLESYEVFSSLKLDAGAPYRPNTTRPVREQNLDRGQRPSSWDWSTSEGHSSAFMYPSFKNWDSMPAEGEATDEYFSAESWSNHLAERAKDPVFELA